MSKLIHNNEIFVERRRELRKNQTKAEEILWWYLRGQKLRVKFKRQHSIGGYIVKNGASTLANTATAGMVVGVSASGELSLPPVVQTFANNDRLTLALFRIGGDGTVNLVANSVILTLNKLT